MGVALNPEKTRIVHVAHGFEFLGFKIQRGKGKFQLARSRIKSKLNRRNLYAIPTQKSLDRFKDQIRTLTRRKIPLRMGELIETINPIIRGWGNYYCRSHVRKRFHQLDGWIIRRLWSHRAKRWRNAMWKDYPVKRLRSELEGTLSPDNLSTKRQWIADLARKYPERALTSLHHLIDLEWMTTHHFSMRPRSAAASSFRLTLRTCKAVAMSNAKLPERVPEIARLFRKLLGPFMVPRVYLCRELGVPEAGSETSEGRGLRLDLHARVAAIAIEELQAEDMPLCRRPQKPA